MRVLITGGSGFLGRQIVAAARNAGHDVLAPRRNELNLETGDGVEDYMGGLSRKNCAVEVLIHSAAYYGGIGINAAEPATIFAKNAMMAVNAFELARRFGIGKVLPIGSACAYPGYLEGDLRERDFWSGPLHESVEAYGFSKKMQLVAQRAYFKQHRIRSNHLILTNLYGPHDVFTEYRSHVVSALVKKFVDAQARRENVILWGDGSPIREFLYVVDAAEAIVRAIDLEHDLEPINIGTGIGTSIRELAEIVKKHTGFDREIEWDTSKPNGAPRKVLDTTRARERMGWSPRWSLDDGLAETIRWYVANKEAADERR
jgi:GDP-L-fucose synthase